MHTVYTILVGSTPESAVPAFVTPSVDEWDTVNPAVRVYEYDLESIIDYNQFFFNLTQANLDGEITWKHEYSPAADYDLDRLDGKGVYKWLNKMKTDDKVFNDHYLHYRNSVYKNGSGECDASCKKNHLCALEFVHGVDYHKCLAG